MDIKNLVPEPINEITIGLKKVQQKNIEWFNSDQNELGDIDFHYTLYFDSNGIRFDFEPYSNLPEKIRSECTVVVNEIFNK